MCEYIICLDDKLVISSRTTDTVNHSAMTEIRSYEVRPSLYSAQRYHLFRRPQGRDQLTSNSCFLLNMQQMQRGFQGPSRSDSARENSPTRFQFQGQVLILSITSSVDL